MKTEAFLSKCPYCNLILTDRCTSTNTILKEQDSPLAPFTLLVAREQTLGRGRLGKNFLSKRGGLYFSLLLKPESPASEMPLITSAAAVAVCNALEKNTPYSFKIKWVNDIFLGDKKVCGILTEGKIDTASQSFNQVILGIGLNVFEPECGFDPSISSIACALFKGKENADIYTDILADIVNNFKAFYERLSAKEFIKEYISRSYLDGKEVTFTKDGLCYTAKVLGVDSLGRLIVLTPHGEMRLNSCEVSIKL